MASNWGSSDSPRSPCAPRRRLTVATMLSIQMLYARDQQVIQHGLVCYLLLLLGLCVTKEHMPMWVPHFGWPTNFRTPCLLDLFKGTFVYWQFLWKDEIVTSAKFKVFKCLGKCFPWKLEIHVWCKKDFPRWIGGNVVWCDCGFLIEN